MSEPVLLSLNRTALLLLLVVLAAWGRHPGRRLLAGAGAAAVAAVALAYFSLVSAADIPTAWLTVLHYGSEVKNIAHLYGHGAHAGSNFPFVAELLGATSRLTLRHVVYMNLGLALLNAVGFFCIAARIQGAAWAVPWTLVFTFNTATFLASFSELPSNLLHAYFLAGVIAWTALNDTQPQPGWVRYAAALLLCLLTALVGLTRPEMALTGVVALSVWGISSVAGEAGWQAYRARGWRLAQRPLSFLSRHPAVIGLLCLAGWAIFLEGGCGHDHLRWGLSALYPFNSQFFLAFTFLTSIGLPLAVALAALAGTGYAAYHFRRFGGIAFSLVVIANLYSIAVGLYEAARYTSYFIGFVLLLGLFGRSAFDEISQRRAWPQTWRQIATLVYVMAWCTMPPLGSLEPFLRPQYSWDGGFAQVLLDRNTQREVRFLVDQTEDNPHCVFVARALQDHAGSMPQPVWVYVLFGKPVEQPIIVAAAEIGLDDAIERHAAGASCVRLYFGDDCNLTYTDRCPNFVAGRQVIDEQRFWSQPFNDPRERGYAAPEVVLATYHWR